MAEANVALVNVGNTGRRLAFELLTTLFDGEVKLGILSGVTVNDGVGATLGAENTALVETAVIATLGKFNLTFISGDFTGNVKAGAVFELGLLPNAKDVDEGGIVLKVLLGPVGTIEDRAAEALLELTDKDEGAEEVLFVPKAKVAGAVVELAVGNLKVVADAMVLAANVDDSLNAGVSLIAGIVLVGKVNGVFISFKSFLSMEGTIVVVSLGTMLALAVIGVAFVVPNENVDVEIAVEACGVTRSTTSFGATTSD